MADEITVVVSMTVRKNNLFFRWPFNGSFRDDLTTGKGPFPGYLDVPTAGRDIYFTDLTQPAYCIFANLDDDDGNYFEVGIYTPGIQRFFPLLEVRPGQAWPLLLSRNLMEEWSGSGTGTPEADNYLRVKAGPEGSTVKGFVGAFDT